MIESMNDALAAVDLCWSMRPTEDGGAEILCDATHPEASASARNSQALRCYVTVCRVKGVSHAELAAALRAKMDGDGASYDAIMVMPNA